MKKILIALMMVVGMVSAAHAQSELTVSYGGYTQMDAMDCHQGGPAVEPAWGALNAGFNFKVADNVWIGPSYTFSSTTRKDFTANKFYYHAVMLNLRYDYFNNGIFMLYGKGGLGSVITHQTLQGESRNKGYIAFQANPLCGQCDVNDYLSIFGELGFGAQGLAQVGIKVKL